MGIARHCNTYYNQQVMMPIRQAATLVAVKAGNIYYNMQARASFPANS
jgi:CO dehydrogenase/acetyl-CoA synthase epsilon subunit